MYSQSNLGLIKVWLIDLQEFELINLLEFIYFYEIR